MAHSDHLKILRQGSLAWNDWRQSSAVTPDLSHVTLESAFFGSVSDDGYNFSGMDFKATKFAGATIQRSTFIRSHLRKVTFDNTSLTGASFEGATLDDCEFRSDHSLEQKFDGAKFIHSRLRKVTFDNTNLTGASFEGATLDDCEFRSDHSLEQISFFLATLRGGLFLTQETMRSLNFGRGSLERVVFQRGKMECCKFTGKATVRDCSFDRVSLVDCDFRYADLSRSSFIETRFENVDLFAANLSGSDLRGAKGYQLDNNLAQGTVMSPAATDEWSTLRRAYTGPRMTFNLIFLGLYFAPIGVKAAILVQLAHLETSSVKMAEMTQNIASTLTLSHDLILHGIGILLSYLTANFPCLNGGCEVYLPLVLLGLSGWSKASCTGRLLLLTVPLLLLYNLARFGLTWLVAPLRDEEQRSGHVPRRSFARQDPDFLLSLAQNPSKPTVQDRVIAMWQRITLRYGWMVYLHRLVLTLAWLAYSLAIFHIIDFLTTDLMVP
jgi:uncharacterized protein YjbI with pentapeptide repeats